jgi:hypothetical protein
LRDSPNITGETDNDCNRDEKGGNSRITVGPSKVVKISMKHSLIHFLRCDPLVPPESVDDVLVVSRDQGRDIRASSQTGQHLEERIIVTGIVGGALLAGR